MKELIYIQANLKAPKSQINYYGKYNYRSCEDILKAAKEHLEKQKCVLTITDDILLVGNRYYVKATATITNESGESVSVSALAREEETKKGMDASQITGTASSYARKYALNGLFAIDNTKDADALNVSPEYTEPERTWKTEEPAQKNDGGYAMTNDEIIREYVAPALAQCTVKEDVTKVFNDYFQLKDDEKFLDALASRVNQLFISEAKTIGRLDEIRKYFLFLKGNEAFNAMLAQKEQAIINAA